MMKLPMLKMSIKERTQYSSELTEKNLRVDLAVERAKKKVLQNDIYKLNIEAHINKVQIERLNSIIANDQQKLSLQELVNKVSLMNTKRKLKI